MLDESPSAAYRKALRQGRKTLRACLHAGIDPYPRVLEGAWDASVAAGSVDLGLHEVPLSLVVGTKTAGRQQTLARDFMPLMRPETEFAAKWEALFEQLVDEGMRDAISCSEYLGMLYVVEGNKRVSVMAYNGAPTVPARVTRVILPGMVDPWYVEFLAAFAKTGLFEVRFSLPGQFPRLQAALGVDADHVWTAEQRRAFSAGYGRFRRAFSKVAPKGLRPMSALDALVVWLRYFPFSQLRDMSDAELAASVKDLRLDLERTRQRADGRGAAGTSGGAAGSVGHGVAAGATGAGTAR